MIDYYKTEEYLKAEKKRKNLLIIYFAMLSVFVAFCVAMLVYYIFLPYKDSMQGVIKAITCSVTAAFIIFTYLYFAVPYKYAKKYAKMLEGIEVGLTENTCGIFVKFDTTITTKDDVECKSLIFEVPSQKKGDPSERKVLVPYEKDYPDFEQGDKVDFITHANLLLKYDVLEKGLPISITDEKTKSSYEEIFAEFDEKPIDLTNYEEILTNGEIAEIEDEPIIEKPIKQEKAVKPKTAPKKSTASQAKSKSVAKKTTNENKAKPKTSGAKNAKSAKSPAGKKATPKNNDTRSDETK